MKRFFAFALVALVFLGIGHATATAPASQGTKATTAASTTSQTPASCLQALKYADQILNSAQAIAQASGDMLTAAGSALSSGNPSDSDLAAVKRGNDVLSEQDASIAGIVTNYEMNSKACSQD